MTLSLPLAEWPDPGRYRVVTYAAIVPSTVVIEPGGEVTPNSPEMFVLTLDATRPGTMPPGEEAVREILCIPVELARRIADAFLGDLESPGY